MAVKFLEKLSNNYFELLDNKKDFNIFCNELAKISKVKNNMILKILLANNLELLSKLAKYPETHLIESKAHWLTSIYQKSCQNEKFKELQK
ncbi:hypothetical protein C2G38_2209189 [Gigaspora rosea]|uniref:Uncharacterized protein n=1 Tax=Gigaspora rosea TaxID=44941 RepID=A0A397UQA9_9GLOM|nr:hypothetical protein C2G38_2209189 [Gigaspora rosea]